MWLASSVQRHCLSCAVSFAWLSMAACGSIADESESTNMPREPSVGLCSKAPHEIEYSLDWDWGQARRVNSGWEVVNDLGYEIFVKSAYLVTYRTGLVACEESDLSDRSRENLYPSCLASKWNWSFFPRAYAGHSFTDDDPAVISTPYVEDLSSPSVLNLGTVSISDQRYCRLHYLLARAEQDAIGLPSNVALVDSSLFVAGHYVVSGSDERIPFSILSSAADGALLELPATQIRDDVSTGMIQVNYEGANIKLIRSLERMWDEVDFVSMSERDVARKIVGNLTSSLRLEITRTQ